MYFGFIEDKEFIPNIYKDENKQKINYYFLCQYNANIDNNLQISIKYHKSSSIKNIFKNYIKDLLLFKKTQQMKKFCPISHFYIKAYLDKKFSYISFKNPRLKIAKIIKILYFDNNLLFNTKDFFTNFVFEKIKKQNKNLKISLKNNLININNEIAILVNIQNINQNDISIHDLKLNKYTNLLAKKKFKKIFFVYPRNKNFTKYINIKNFLYENKETLLKLVPYSISNIIIRR